jgi:hypothetical protein
MENFKLKPGDLVRGIPRYQKYSSGKITPMIGILLEKSGRSSVWGDEEIIWWKVLCEDGIVVEERDIYMELIR